MIKMPSKWPHVEGLLDLKGGVNALVWLQDEDRYGQIKIQSVQIIATAERFMLIEC